MFQDRFRQTSLAEDFKAMGESTKDLPSGWKKALEEAGQKKASMKVRKKGGGTTTRKKRKGVSAGQRNKENKASKKYYKANKAKLLRLAQKRRKREDQDPSGLVARLEQALEHGSDVVKVFSNLGTLADALGERFGEAVEIFSEEDSELGGAFAVFQHEMVSLSQQVSGFNLEHASDEACEQFVAEAIGQLEAAVEAIDIPLPGLAPFTRKQRSYRPSGPEAPQDNKARTRKNIKRNGPDKQIPIFSGGGIGLSHESREDDGSGLGEDFVPRDAPVEVESVVLSLEKALRDRLEWLPGGVFLLMQGQRPWKQMDALFLRVENQGGQWVMQGEYQDFQGRPVDLRTVIDLDQGLGAMQKGVAALVREIERMTESREDGEDGFVEDALGALIRKNFSKAQMAKALGTMTKTGARMGLAPTSPEERLMRELQALVKKNFKPKDLKYLRSLARQGSLVLSMGNGDELPIVEAVFSLEEGTKRPFDGKSSLSVDESYSDRYEPELSSNLDGLLDGLNRSMRNEGEWRSDGSDLFDTSDPYYMDVPADIYLRVDLSVNGEYLVEFELDDAIVDEWEGSLDYGDRDIRRIAKAIDMVYERLITNQD